MSKKYELTKQIHDHLPQINQKHGLEVEVESNYFWVAKKYNEKYLIPKIEFFDDVMTKGLYTKLCPEIQTPQIRQILVGLKEVLGETAEASQAEALWLKWFKPDFDYDGLSLFDREPETVLQELVEILENLIK